MAISLMRLLISSKASKADHFCFHLYTPELCHLILRNECGGIEKLLHFRLSSNCCNDRIMGIGYSSCRKGCPTQPGAYHEQHQSRLSLSPPLRVWQTGIISCHVLQRVRRVPRLAGIETCSGRHSRPDRGSDQATKESQNTDDPLDLPIHFGKVEGHQTLVCRPCGPGKLGREIAARPFL